MTMLEIGIEEDLHDYDDTLTFERIHDPRILGLFQQNFYHLGIFLRKNVLTTMKMGQDFEP